MAFKELMNWEGSPNYRWKKMYKRVQYVVSCSELDAPRNRDASRQAANKWWENKLAEINSLEEVFVPECEDDLPKLKQIELLDKKIAYAKAQLPELVDKLKALKREIIASDPSDYLFQDVENTPEDYKVAREFLEMFGMKFSENTPPQLHENLLGNQSVWAERLKKFKTVPEKNKVGNFAKFFLTEARSNEKPATADELKKYINMIIHDAGIWTLESDISKTNSDTVNTFITWLNKKNYNPNTHNKVLGIFRRFITRASQEDGILETIPRNLLLKTHRKRTAIKKVKIYSNIISQINKLPPKMRLWSVLALNCGCSSCDLGSLTWKDIDQKTWRLTRKRVKTLTTDPNAPEVTFKLWEITINLLKRLPHREGLLFVSNTKSPMYICDFVTNAKGELVVRKKDLFGSYWNKLKDKPDFTIGKFRSIGATIIENECSTFVDKHSTLYLGRMPKGLDDKYYKANQKEFMDKAIHYLGEKLKINKIKMEDIPKFFKF